MNPSEHRPASVGFDLWWDLLTWKAERLGWKLGHKDSYREYYEDSDSPDEALKMEIAEKGKRR